MAEQQSMPITIETHEHAGDFKSGETLASAISGQVARLKVLRSRA